MGWFEHRPSATNTRDAPSPIKILYGSAQVPEVTMTEIVRKGTIQIVAVLTLPEKIEKLRKMSSQKQVK